MAPVNIAVCAVRRPAVDLRPAAQASSLIAELFPDQESHREFYKANHAKAMVFAYAALKNRSEAQDAVSDTYVELLERRTTQEHFFRALKFNIIDRQRRMARERDMFEPTEKVFDPRHLPGEDIMAGGESDEFSLEPASSEPDNQDPLDILIAREEQGECEDQFARALEMASSQRKYRWIRRKKWSRGLLAGTEKGTPRE